MRLARFGFWRRGALVAGVAVGWLGVGCSDSEVGTCRALPGCPSPVEANGECFCSADASFAGGDADSDAGAGGTGSDGGVSVDSGGPGIDASSTVDSAADGPSLVDSASAGG